MPVIQPAAKQSRVPIAKLLKGASPEIRKLLTAAHEQRFRIKPTKNGHFQVFARQRRGPDRVIERVTVPGTPSEYRSVLNSRSDLRRIGVRFNR
jgi:hypothetical protein